MNGVLDRAAVVWGAVFTIVGVAFLAQAWGWWTVRADVLLPLLLIVAGAALVVSGMGRRTSS